MQLGRWLLLQTFDDDVECDVEEIRRILDEENQESNMINSVIKPQIVESLAEPVGRIWKELQEFHTQRGEFFVASPLSRTPLPIYEWLLQNAQSIPRWDKLKFVFMDEQTQQVKGKRQYFPVDNSASFEGFARKHFLHPLSEKVSVPEEQVGMKPNLEDFSAFDQLLDAHEGLDLLILAIGEEGHYALVMPGTPLEQGYHATRISPKVVTQHVDKSGPYQGSDFGNSGISLGPKQVLGAKHIVVIISGKNKRELTKQLFSYKAFDPMFPMSVIFHPRVKEKVQIFLTKDVL